MKSDDLLGSEENVEAYYRKPKTPMASELDRKTESIARIDRSERGNTFIGVPRLLERSWVRIDRFAPRMACWERNPFTVRVTGPHDYSPAVFISEVYVAECACCWLNIPHSAQSHGVAVTANSLQHRGALPHGVSCPGCWEVQSCNHCGERFKTYDQCTNGRCSSCCAKVCKHVTR